MHIHEYNQIDAVLKKYDNKNSLGKMYIKYNFILPKNIEKDECEEIFNERCKIKHKTLSLNNKSKYWPTSYYDDLFN